MTRESTRYNTIVGVKDGEIFVLEETFKYSDNFEGAVGYSMRPLTQDDIDTWFISIINHLLTYYILS